MVDIFDRHWLSAAALTRTGASSLTDFERHIIARLSAGLTDAAVANEIQISSRTVQRHVKRVMDRLGARSRLELGMRLAGAEPGTARLGRARDPSDARPAKSIRALE